MCPLFCYHVKYILGLDKFKKLKIDFESFEKKQVEKQAGDKRNFYDFIKEKHSDYFNINKKTIEFNSQTKQENNLKFIDLKKTEISIKDVINYQFIKANRDVSNKESDKSLSSLSSKIYEKIEADEYHKDEVEKFKNALRDTDIQLCKSYEKIFNEVIGKVSKLGGVKQDDTIIKITSTLQHRELLKGNTSVMYEHDDTHSLPESYNGLGYMNLISLIFEIEILMKCI